MESVLMIMVVEKTGNRGSREHEVCFYVGGTRVSTGITGDTAEAAVERFGEVLKIANRTLSDE